MEMEADKENSQSQTGVPVILGPVDDEHKKNHKVPLIIRGRLNPGPVRMKTDIEGLYFDFNDGARVLLPKGNYNVRFINSETDYTIFSVDASDVMVMTTKKYFIPYRIEVRRDDCQEPVWIHEYSAKNKKVFLKYPTSGILGDCLAWFPYAEEFRKQHGAEVYVVVNQKMAEILKPGYPELHFITRTEKDEKEGKWPDELPEDIYATYYLTVPFIDENRLLQPVDYRTIGLHTNAAMILGLDPKIEHPPRLLPSPQARKERQIKEPYVCIAVNGSSQTKQWNNAGGWINVIRHLKKLGYRVLCIDREDFHQAGSYCNSIPFGSEDFTGNKPLQERIDLLYHADFFVGISSGLSWLAWGVGKPVVLISGFSLPYTEFYTPYRVINLDVCNGCWNDMRIHFNNTDAAWCPRHKNTDRQFECSRNITPEYVNKVIDKLIKNEGLTPPGR